MDTTQTNDEWRIGITHLYGGTTVTLTNKAGDRYRALRLDMSPEASKRFAAIVRAAVAGGASPIDSPKWELDMAKNASANKCPGCGAIVKHDPWYVIGQPEYCQKCGVF